MIVLQCPKDCNWFKLVNLKLFTSKQKQSSIMFYVTHWHTHYHWFKERASFISDFMDCPSRARLLLLDLLNIPGWSLKAGFFLSFPHLKRSQNVKNICTYPITTSATCSSTLGIGSIMISSSSLGLLVLETFSLFCEVEPSSLLTIAAAPGTLRLRDGIEIA